MGRSKAPRRVRAATVIATSVLVATSGCGGGSTGPAEPNDSATAAPTFTDVTEQAGLDGFRHERGAAGNFLFPEINGSGVAFIDYDGDGWQDLLVAGGGTWEGSGMAPVPAIWLYRNLRDGTFRLATGEAGLDQIQDYSYGFAVADYDNDGDADFYLTTVGINRLFRNDGGRFTEVHAASGAAGLEEWSNSAAFFDADRDGWLDLYVTNYVAWSPDDDVACVYGSDRRQDYCGPLTYTGIPSRYFRSNGDGTFSDQTVRSGFLPSPGKSMGVTLLDHNEDGWIDLAVANDGEPDHLYENQGDGTFQEKGIRSGMAVDIRGQSRAGMGIDSGDVDGSGNVTIFIGNFSNETMGVYQFDGNGLFVDRTGLSGIGAPSTRTLTFGLVLFDADLDGFQDVFAANGHVSLFAEQRDDAAPVTQVPHLFMNNGDGTFSDVASEIPAMTVRRLGRGAAVADFDRDGDLDVVMTENDGGVYLFRNDARTIRNETHTGSTSDEPGFVRVSLEGVTSNRSAIGADLRLYADGRLHQRRVRSGSSYLSQSELPVTFGLGAAQGIDSLVVTWPSGLRQVFEEVALNSHYVLKEVSDRLHVERR